MLQSDKGISSIRLAEALGISQPTAWRMGHALRLMVGREQGLDGAVEIDGLYVGGKPRRDPNYSPPGRGRKGQPKTVKTPAENASTCGRAAAAGCERRCAVW
jgi:hypothetical protein